MAISGIQTINIGLPNESTDSDSLWVAFTKTKNNFDILKACASPYSTFTAGDGIGITPIPSTGVVTIVNTGVTGLIAGDGININSGNGLITISSTGGGGNGGLSSVGVLSSTLSVSNSPLVTNGNITLNLPSTGVSPGTYTYPTVTVDNYGRITTIASASAAGTVTSVGITPGFGIQVTGSPVTTSGAMTVLNTGVTRLSAGTGISLSGSNGNVTISSTLSAGTVTSVGVSSATLNVTNTPVVAAGTINVELPNDIYLSGNIIAGNVNTGGKVLFYGSEDLASATGINLALTTAYFTTAAPETATLAAGSEGQIKILMMKGDSGNMVITVTNAGWKSSGTGTITFDDIGDGCILQYISSKWFCIGNNGAVFG